MVSSLLSERSEKRRCFVLFPFLFYLYMLFVSHVYDVISTLLSVFACDRCSFLLLCLRGIAQALSDWMCRLAVCQYKF